MISKFKDKVLSAEYAVSSFDRYSKKFKNWEIKGVRFDDKVKLFASESAKAELIRIQQAIF